MNKTDGVNLEVAEALGYHWQWYSGSKVWVYENKDKKNASFDDHFEFSNGNAFTSMEEAHEALLPALPEWSTDLNLAFDLVKGCHFVEINMEDDLFEVWVGDGELFTSTDTETLAIALCTAWLAYKRGDNS